MIPREPLWLIVLFLPIVLPQERTYDTNDWIPITPQTSQSVEVEEKTASDRALSLDVPAQRFPEDDYKKRQFLRPAGPRKLKHPMEYKFETPPPPPSKLRPEINYYNGEAMTPFVFDKPRIPAYYPPQKKPKLTPTDVYDQYQLPFNRSFYQSLSPVAINNEFYQAVNASQPLLPQQPKTVVEQESVQLVYVPVENLKQDRPSIKPQPPKPKPQQQLFEPQPQYYEVQQQQALPQFKPLEPYYTPQQEKLVAPPDVKQLRLENIQKDFIQQALEASKLQQQFKDEINPITQEVTPSPPKQKAHQPPLAVFLESQQKAEVTDVLDVLKGANSIAVQDKVTPDSPQIFIGPSNLESPDGYTKFPLPYLNNINGNRIERKIEQLPFFVAPVSYKAPPGYSKISLPSPHVGSVVVSVPQYTSTTAAPYSSFATGYSPLDPPRTAAPQFEQTYYSQQPQTYENTQTNPLELAINQFELDQINNDFVDTSTVRVKQSTTSRPSAKPTRGRFSYDSDQTTERTVSRGRVRGRGRGTSRTTTTTTVAPETDRYTVLEEFVAGPSTQGAYEEQTETSRRSSTPFSGSRYLPEGSFEGQVQYGGQYDNIDGPVENIPANVYSLEPVEVSTTTELPRSSTHRFSAEASYENRAPVQQYTRVVNIENSAPEQQYIRGDVGGNSAPGQQYTREDVGAPSKTVSDDNSATVQQYTREQIRAPSKTVTDDNGAPVQQYIRGDSAPGQQYTREQIRAPSKTVSDDNSAPAQQYIRGDVRASSKTVTDDNSAPVQQYIRGDSAPGQQYTREQIRAPSKTVSDDDRASGQHYTREDPRAPSRPLNDEQYISQYVTNDNTPVQQYTTDENKAPAQQYISENTRTPAQQYANEEREPVQQFITEQDVQQSYESSQEQLPDKSSKSPEEFLENFYKPNFDQTYISLQDQAVRSLLVPNLLAPTSKEQASTEEVTAPTTTTTKRSRGRRPASTSTSAPSRTRVSNRSRRPVSRMSTERIASSEDYGARQRFRTRGRPLQNDITDRISTTENEVKAAQSYMQFEHSIDEQQIITINPQEVEDYQPVSQPVSTTEGGRLEYENTNSKILDVQIEHIEPQAEVDYGRINANIKSAGILNNNKEISSTARPSRLRGSTRGRSRFATSTTTSRPVSSRISTRPSVKSTTVKQAEPEESYGFIRQPNYTPANLDIQARTPVQFVGEVRPKFRQSTTEVPSEEAETPKPRIRGRTRVSSRKPEAEQVTRRSGSVSTRTRSRGASHYRPETKRHSEDEDVSDQNYPATFLQKLDSSRAAVDDEEDQSPYQSIYQPKIVPFNSISAEDKPVEEVTEPPQSLALVQTEELPTTTQEELTTKRRRGVWKLVRHHPVDPLEVQESQNYQTVLNAFDNIQKVDPYSKGDDFVTTSTTTEAVTTMEPEVASTMPPPTTKESIFDTIYEMFGIWSSNTTTEAPATTTTINPTFPEEITQVTTTEEVATEQDLEETTTELVTTTTTTTTTPSPTVKFAVEPWEMREVKTSTSTEVSHETEICYKGRCVKSRQKIKKRL